RPVRHPAHRTRANDARPQIYRLSHPSLRDAAHVPRGVPKGSILSRLPVLGGVRKELPPHICWYVRFLVSTPLIPAPFASVFGAEDFGGARPLVLSVPRHGWDKSVLACRTRRLPISIPASACRSVRPSPCRRSRKVLAPQMAAIPPSPSP